MRPDAPDTLTITDARLRTAPGAAPIERATLRIADGRILGWAADGPTLPGSPSLSVSGRTVLAGYWNAHVHFTEAKWRRLAREGGSALAEELERFAGRWGFTNVVDAGSDPRVTLPIRARVRSGSVPGPGIRTAGPSIFPPRAIPYYLRPQIPFYVLWFVPSPRSAAGARRAVARSIAQGADLVKLFTGSYVARGVVRPMPREVARAAVASAHAAGQLVYAHPSNGAGTRVAVESGVDVLAHAPDAPEGIDDDLLRRMVAQGTAMIPTLQMFGATVSRSERYLGPIRGIVARFRALGGELWFGTDVGYLPEYDPSEEFEALTRTGIPPPEIHAMLTERPARRFERSPTAGTIAPGAPADLVVLDEDPYDHPTAFARPRATMRGGRWIAGRIP